MWFPRPSLAALPFRIEKKGLASAVSKVVPVECKACLTSAFTYIFICKLGINIMPRAKISRHTVIVLSVRQSVCYKYFSSLAKN